MLVSKLSSGGFDELGMVVAQMRVGWVVWWVVGLGIQLFGFLWTVWRLRQQSGRPLPRRKMGKSGKIWLF